jgi:Reverse transcriptase (RNA-dependent DNA polymerase)
MRLPTGYYKNETNKVCSVLQALYGLKQSAFLWNNVLDEKLQKLGFKPLLEDPCVYIRTGKSFAIIYVDDAVTASLTKDEVDEIKRELNKDFPIKEIGELGKFLGWHVMRDYERGVITLTQARYIEKILAEAGMETCWPTGTPLNPRHWKNEDETPTNTAEYQRLTGHSIS